MNIRSFLAMASMFAMGHESYNGMSYDRPKRGNDSTDGNGTPNKTNQEVFSFRGIVVEALNEKNAHRKIQNEIKKLYSQSYKFTHEGILYSWDGSLEYDEQLKVVDLSDQKTEGVHPHLLWRITNKQYSNK